MHHPQVVQSSITNDYLRVKVDGHIEPQLVSKLLLQVSVRELHNNLVSDVDNVGLKEARYEENNIIISDSTLRATPILNISSIYKVMFGCKCCISDKSIHSSLLSWRDYYLKKLKDLSQNSQNRISGGKANRIYETCNDKFMSHGSHIYTKAYDMAKATMYVYSHSYHALPH